MLNAAAMAASIKAQLDPVLPAGSAMCDLTFLTAFCQGIISHIQGNAVVPSGIAVTVSGATHTGNTTATGTVQ